MWNFLSLLIWSIIMLRTDPQGLANFLIEIKNFAVIFVKEVRFEKNAFEI